MGMDLIGIAPTSDVGESIRFTVWWWRPLWEFCSEMAPEITAGMKRARPDGSEGLDEVDAWRLGATLLDAIDDGRAERWSKALRAEETEVRETCPVCHGTGVRTDAAAIGIGMPEMVIGPEEKLYGLGKRVKPDHPRYGQKGWCNGCNGVGTRPSDQSGYRFHVDAVRAFAAFLCASGGFRIG